MFNDWLILHGGALGDLALTLRFALHLPGIQLGGALHVVSRTDPGDLSLCRPSIRRYSSEGAGWHWLFSELDEAPPERLTQLAAGRRVLSALGGVETRVHERLERLGAEAVYSFDPRPEPEAATHILKQWRRRLEGQGVLICKCIHQYRGGPRLHVPDEWRTESTSSRDESETTQPVAQPAKGQPILIHPGSGGRAKCWPLPKFVELARLLQSERGAVVRFLLGPVELETWPDERLDALRWEFDTLEMPRTNDLVRHLASARCLIGNDSGPAHLAALLETPTVTIFGPTASAVWRPVSPVARVLQAGPTSADEEDWGISIETVAAQVPE